MNTLQVAYAPRMIRPLDLWQEEGWRLKMYGIASQRPQPRPELIEAAKTVARHRLPRLPLADGCYGVGFLGVRDGSDGNFVFVDWWANECELHHHAYASSPDTPELLESVTPSGLIACVWDLRVLCFERQAWMNAVLTNPDGPDVDAYLARQLSEDI